MLGLPPWITYDEWVQLWLNWQRVQMRQVHTQVEAARIIGGKPGPIGYYELFTQTRDQAAALMGEQKLLTMMSNAFNSNRR